MAPPPDSVEPPADPAPDPSEGAGSHAVGAGDARASELGSPSVVSTRAVEIVVAILLLGFAGVMAFDNWRTGIGWAADGPMAGYFPFYLSAILACASLYWLLEATLKRSRRASPPRSFVHREQLGRVLQVFVPTVLFCLATQFLGLYVASFLLVAGFMRFVGRIAWWKAIVTSVVFALAMFLVFDVAFDVIMPKGPLEGLLGR